MEQKGLADQLREVAAELDTKNRGETLRFTSQNLSSGDVPEKFVVEKSRGSRHDISVRGQRLSYDWVTFQAVWVVEGGRGQGVFQTPDGMLYRVVGRVGDAWDASSMSFRRVQNEDAPAIIVEALSNSI